MTWTKYKIEKKQTYSGGTWVDVVPLEVRYGESIGEYSTEEECWGTTIFRWVDIPITIDYICDGVDKHYKQKKQKSTDSGATWSDVIPYVYQQGNLYEADSLDCILTPGNYRIKVIFNDDTEGTVNCIQGDTKLVTGDTYPNFGYDRMKSGATEVYVGDCIQTIGEATSAMSEAGDAGYWPLYNLSAMTVLSMADSVTDIGYRSVYGNSNLKTVRFSNNLQTIWPSAFAGCCNLANFQLPNSLKTIHNHAFESLRYVPKFVVPDSVEYIGARAIPQSSTTVVLGTSLNKIENLALEGDNYNYNYFRKLIFKSSTPPSVIQSQWSSDTAIGSRFVVVFVPSGSVSSYESLVSSHNVGYGRTPVLPMEEYVESGDTMIATTFSGTSPVGIFSFYFPEINSGTVKKNYVRMETRINSSKPLAVVLSDKVTNIDNNAFGWPSNYEDNMQSITIHATTPPTINTVYSTSLQGILLNNRLNYPIYVPAESVNAYKESVGFSRYASRIQAIPT